MGSVNPISKLKIYLLNALEEAIKEFVREEDISRYTINMKIASIMPIHLTSTEEIEISKILSSYIEKTSKSKEPYGVQIIGKINNIPFKIYLCGKYGNLYSPNKNDITTYGNILRYYLDTKDQRISNRTIFDYNVLLSRIRGDEIVSFAVFVLDRNKENYNLFLLEEIDGDLYINPKNSMLQERYQPSLKLEPASYSEFLKNFLDSLIISLSRTIEKATIEKNRIREILKYFE